MKPTPTHQARRRRSTRKILIGAAVILGAVALLGLRRPAPRYDLRNVEPKLCLLSTPYQSVNVGLVGSGGDIWMRILDRDGHQLRLAMPASSLPGTSRYQYSQLLLGVEYASDPRGENVPFSDDTRQMLIDLIGRYRRFSDKTDLVLMRLRGAPVDYVRFWGRVASRVVFTSGR